MTKELLVLLYTAALLSAVVHATGSHCEGEATQLQSSTTWMEQLARVWDVCLQTDLVQIVRFEEGEEMEAFVLTLSEGAKFKPIKQIAEKSLFFLVDVPPTFDPCPKFLIVSSDGEWVLRVESKGGVAAEAVADEGLASHFSMPDYHFALRGGLDNALLVSSRGGVDIAADGTLQVGVANSRYQVRIVMSVDTCSCKEEEGMNDKKDYKI